MIFKCGVLDKVSYSSHNFHVKQSGHRNKRAFKETINKPEWLNQFHWLTVKGALRTCLMNLLSSQLPENKHNIIYFTVYVKRQLWSTNDVMVFLMINSQPDAEEKKISTLMDTKNMMDINVILEYYGVWWNATWKKISIIIILNNYSFDHYYNFTTSLFQRRMTFNGRRGSVFG